MAYCTPDSHPVSPGHSLIIPFRHCASFFDLTPEEVAACMELLVHERKTLDDELRPDGYNVGVNVGAAAGQSLFHVHIHLIPRYLGDSSRPQGGVRQVIPEKAHYLRQGHGRSPARRTGSGAGGLTPRAGEAADSRCGLRFRLVALDFDGVLVRQQSTWGMLHEAFGTGRAARRNLVDFETGEIDYLEFMRRDISLWGRRSYEEIKRVLLRCDLDPEAESVIGEWRREGRHVTIISAGIDILVGEVARRLGIEHCVANGLETDADGNLTGNGILRVDLRRKDVALRRVANSLGCPLGHTVSVGDSPFDLPVLRASGLGIGYGDRTRVGPLSGLVDAWADTFGDISRIVREFERSDRRN